MSPLKILVGTTLALRVALKSTFGFKDLRENQLAMCARVMPGGDAFAVLPTGGGKSLLYQLPMMAKALVDSKSVGVVVSPLISLMLDEVKKLRSLGVRVCCVQNNKRKARSGGDNSGHSAPLASAFSGEYNIVYGTPETLCKDMAVAEIKRLVMGLNVSVLAIDEAHCISDWGVSFRPEYRNIAKLKEALPAPIATVVVTTTVNSRVKVDVIANLNLDLSSGVGFVQASFDRPNIKLVDRFNNAMPTSINLCKSCVNFSSQAAPSFIA